MVRVVPALMLAVAMALGPVQPVFADSLLESGARLARAAGRRAPAARSATAGGQEPAAEAPTGRRRRFYVMLAAAVAAGAAMYAIDRGVEDNTPSTKGTRKD